MDMDFIKVDQGKCTRCGACATVCPGVIGMTDEGPRTIRDLCVSCGQCVAVCPERALDNTNTPLTGQVPIEENTALDSGRAAQFLRSRRSIRNYQPESVPREKIVQLLDIARMAPTACNSQGVAYHIVDNPSTLRQISATVMDWTESELKSSPAMASAKYAPHLAMMVEQYRQAGEDVVLRFAPCLIVAVADQHSFASVTGIVQSSRVWTNAGAKPGDVLILTKALGTGILATAAKAEMFHSEQRPSSKA